MCKISKVFFENFTGRGLSLDSEQATEACHSQFDIFFKRYSPPSDKKSPEYEKRHKKAVIDFNDTNLL